MPRKLMTALALFLTLQVAAQTQSTPDAKMNQFIAALMAKMTLDEKIGQLNLPGAGDITTGQASSSGIAQKIKEGKEETLALGGLAAFLAYYVGEVLAKYFL